MASELTIEQQIEAIGARLIRIDRALNDIRVMQKVLLAAEQRRQRQRLQAYPGDQTTIDMLAAIAAVEEESH